VLEGRVSAGDKRAVAAIVLLGAIAFGGALTAGFVWDDILIVEQNPRIRHLENIPSFFASGYWGAGYPTGLYRPLPLSVHAAAYALFGLNPAAHHAINIVLHIASGVLLFLVARRIFPSVWPAWFAAALFAVHPVQSETVIAIVGLSGILSTLFGLAAWLVAGGGSRGIVLAPLLLLLSMLAKETGVIWAVPILAEILFIRRDGRRRAGAAFVAFAGAALLYLIARTAALGGLGVPKAGQILAGTDIAARVVTMLRGYAEYARLLFWPATLSGDYSPGAIPVGGAIDGAAATGLVLLLLTWAAVLWSCRESRPALVGLVLFLAALAPVSNVLFPIGAVIAERFLYPALAGFSLTAAALFARAARRRRGVAVAAAFLILLPLAGRSAVRTQDWRSHEAFMESLIEAMPDSYRAKEALAEKYLREGDYGAALRAAREARSVYPADLSLVLLEARVLAAGSRKGEAAELLRSFVSDHPDDIRARILLGETLYDLGRFAEALDQYKEALRRNGGEPRALIGAGRSHDQLGNRGEAVRFYSRALEVQPDLPDVSMRL